jgi:hypothetical protein
VVHPADDVGQSDYTPCIMANARAEALVVGSCSSARGTPGSPGPQRRPRPLQAPEKVGPRPTVGASGWNTGLGL